jgi:tryptophan 2,3-dioxygenase
VSVLHDEYFFIRALQCHELTFTILAADVRAATRAVRAGAPDTAAAHLRHATEVFARAALLFRIVATMRAASFHAFREFTQGASAIQSDQYKRFEAACGTPDRARLWSDAFAGVPAVRAEVLAGQDNLSQALLDTRRPGAHGWDHLDAAITGLEGSHQRWKAAHRGLAARMLGAAAGSGYTEGVPYLDRCLENRLFDLPLAA